MREKILGRYGILLVVALALLGGIGIGKNLPAEGLISSASPKIIRGNQKGTLTNSLLGFEVNTKGEFSELNPIKTAIQEFITEREREGRIKIISVYFRLLNSGRWFAVNTEELYSPASLLKIPIMMAYYKQAEETPGTLAEKLYDDGQFAPEEQTTIPEERKLEKGRFYTIEDLIERMIIDSNNEAKSILSQNLHEKFLETIYRELDVENPYRNEGDSMSVTEFPFFFRILYNATYLSQKYSEKALGLLSQASFDTGLPAKLPAEIPVAHKFGFRIMRNTTPEIGELHDCGIIYYPEHPYLLCIMTKGYTPEAIQSVIQDLSLLTYKGVEDFFKAKD